MRFSKGRNHLCLAPDHAEKWFAPCNPKLTFSGVMDQLPPRLKLLQHAFHGRAHLSVFVGSGLTESVLVWVPLDLTFPDGINF